MSLVTPFDVWSWNSYHDTCQYSLRGRDCPFEDILNFGGVTPLFEILGSFYEKHVFIAVGNSSSIKMPQPCSTPTGCTRNKDLKDVQWHRHTQTDRQTDRHTHTYTHTVSQWHTPAVPYLTGSDRTVLANSHILEMYITTPAPIQYRPILSSLRSRLHVKAAQTLKRPQVVLERAAALTVPATLLLSAQTRADNLHPGDINYIWWQRVTKRHNFVVFQWIWTIDTPKSRYWNELSNKLKTNETTIGIPCMTS